MPALQSVDQATRELDRLIEIRNRIAGLIVEIQSSKSYVESHATWIKIYTDRLRTNVIPEIETIKAYLKSQA